MKSLKQSYVDALVRQRVRIGRFSEEMGRVGVYVVQPGEITSMVFYQGEIRFFPIVNEEDQVVGGKFG